MTVQIELPISMGNYAIIVSTHTRFQRSKCLCWDKTEQSIYERLLVSVLTTFSAPPQILAVIDSFAQSPETKK